MRLPRLKQIPGHTRHYFHCLSRVVDRQFLFEAAEREQFARYLREYKAFCGVRVLTYCILSNHFHLLLEVPERPAQPLTGEQWVARLEGLSGAALTAAAARQRLAMFRQAGDAVGERQFIDQACATLWDLSGFLKRLKQRFTQWYNRQHGRKGTLWEERFKSVLVEGAGETLATVAAYVDLNPVRAGLVEDPKDYRWCGYGEAVAGRRKAQEGLRAVIAGGEHVVEQRNTLDQPLAKYREWLFGRGEQREGTTETGEPLRKGFTREAVLAVVTARGQLSLPEYLRLRVRYFADGTIFGTRGFVDEIFTAVRGRFGARRQTGARPMRGLASGLCTLRDLQKRVFA